MAKRSPSVEIDDLLFALNRFFVADLGGERGERKVVVQVAFISGMGVASCATCWCAHEDQGGGSGEALGVAFEEGPVEIDSAVSKIASGRGDQFAGEPVISFVACDGVSDPVTALRAFGIVSGSKTVDNESVLGGLRRRPRLRIPIDYGFNVTHIFPRSILSIK